MPSEIDIVDFLLLAKNIPVIDVRSPSEYRKGHIPDAINLPLFSDDERVKVGTLYIKNGKDDAYLLGLEIVGPKLKSFVEEVKQLAVDQQLLVHCWRGGMRSNSMAWLFEQVGIKASVLRGGYKSYRRYVLEWFLIKPDLIVLGGMTGSGKTEILNELQKTGCQVVDLECIAHHKGSAFGGLGQTIQPTQEQFENDLFSTLQLLNYKLPTWIEDESLSIGKVILPKPLYEFMKQANVICIRRDKETRIARLINEYALFSSGELAESIRKIAKRLGGKDTNDALAALLEGDYKTVANIALHYYDKSYQNLLKLKPKEKLIDFTPKSNLPNEIAEEILKLQLAEEITYGIFETHTI
jgi:tRNA 2-selenouridine synthase